MSLPSVFISYSQKDREWKERLVLQLGVLQQQGLLDIWHDYQIPPGQDWAPLIDKALITANVAILLVTANFLTSQFIKDKEIPVLLKRRAEDGLQVLPILTTPFAWRLVPWLSEIQHLPRGDRFLSQGSNAQTDTDLMEIAEAVYRMLAVSGSKATTPPSKPHDPEKISIGRLPNTGRFLIGRERELKQLDDAWSHSATGVLSLVAWGGVGKTALVNQWLRSMERDRYRGADLVFAWSFFTDRAISAELFLCSALAWFGDPDPNKGTIWDKGDRLSELIGKRRTLLVLDGLEALQYPPGSEAGKLKDPGLHTLLRNLAASNSGLCVITTRLPVTDLDDFGDFAPQMKLEHLTPQAGAQLLRKFDVEGDDLALEEAARAFGGHCLSLTLLGSYLRDRYMGDVQRWREIELKDSRGMIASYETWLEQAGEEGLAMLAMLAMLGLFNGPAEAQAVAAVCAAPPLLNFTDKINALSQPERSQVLVNLRCAGLLAEPHSDTDDKLDAHPLVREYFGDRLKKTNAEAWRQGQLRLYEYFRRKAIELPETMEEMMWLFDAVAHGCKAGRYQAVFDEVIWPRISRKYALFHVYKMGASNSALASVVPFFTKPFEDIVPDLDPRSIGPLLTIVSLSLRGLGKYSEAIAAADKVIVHGEKYKDWEAATIGAIYLSRSCVVLGQLSRAIEASRRAVVFSGHAATPNLRKLSLNALADALHQSGQFDEAEKAYLETRAIAADKELELQFAVQTYQYWELLLTLGRYEEVIEQSLVVLPAFKEHNAGDIVPSLFHLSLGKAYFLQASTKGAADYTCAEDRIDFFGNKE